MKTAPQEIVDMVIGFLAEDRASLLACALAGTSLYSPTRAQLFAEIEVNSLQRFQELLELSSASLMTFEHETLNSFSFVRTISIRDVDTWITPEVLPTLLFLPLLAPFQNVKVFRIDSLTLPCCIEARALPTVLAPPLGIGPRVKVGAGGLGASRGVPTSESFSDSRDFLSGQDRSTASLEALILGNCQVPSLGWFLHYVSYFPNLKSLSLIDFTWGSVDGKDVSQAPTVWHPQPTVRPSGRLGELTLNSQYTPLVACVPSILFETFSGSLRILRLAHIDMLQSVDVNEGSIDLDPSYITLSSLNFLTHLTLPPVAVWLQAKQQWLPDLLSTITSTPNLEELNIHLLFSPISIKVQLDAVVWSTVDLILGRKLGEESECGVGNGLRAGRRGSMKGYAFANLEVVKITSADFNPGRPPLDGEARLRIKEWLVGYMPRIYERRVLQVPLGD